MCAAKSHIQQQNQQALMPQIFELPDGGLDFHNAFLSPEEADALLLHLIENTTQTPWEVLKTQAQLAPAPGFFNNVGWQQNRVFVYGKWHLTPRLTAWQSEAGAAYRYSGLMHPATPMTPLMANLKNRIESATGCRFNSVLLNWYRSGADAMGLHADNEPELGPNPTIASVSLGATRKFILQHNASKTKHALLLTHGSLLVMRGALQHHWKHNLPRALKVMEGRINLTFRYIQPTS